MSNEEKSFSNIFYDKPWAGIIYILIAFFILRAAIQYIIYVLFSENFETIENNFNTDLNPIDLNNNIIQNDVLENNMQSQNLTHNEILGFNNDLNQYSLLTSTPVSPIVTTCNGGMDLVNIDKFNQVDIINSFIGAQLTDKQIMNDNEAYEMTQLRNNNNGKYSDVYAWSNQNPINIETSVDKINAIRTSNGTEKFSDMGNTIWEVYDNLMK